MRKFNDINTHLFLYSLISQSARDHHNNEHVIIYYIIMPNSCVEGLLFQGKVIQLLCLRDLY